MSYTDELQKLDIEDLWALHARVTKVLERRVRQEKQRLEERLKMLGVSGPARRAYPPVLPKYCNPDYPSETWAGRGKRPRWLVAQLRAGRRLDDFRILVQDTMRAGSKAASYERGR